MKTLTALIAGLVFGFGLIISGMANPAKIQNFLDLFGTFDPSLIFVMGGAILVATPGFWLVTKRSQPFFNDAFQLPTTKDINARLVGGAALFGIGWGLGGYCPGPALTSLPLAATGTIVFVATMLTGMWLARIISN